MVVTDEDALVADLRSLVGESLRTVAPFTRDGYELLYVRGDLEGRADRLGDDIHDDLVLQGIGTGHLEDLFEAGPLQCSVHRFEELTAVHFVEDRDSGLFVAVDSDADIPLSELADACRSHF